MATCCGADPEGYAHSYTHYVELRPTTQRGSGYIHRYLEAVHTEMNHSPQSIPVCPNETGHHQANWRIPGWTAQHLRTISSDPESQFLCSSFAKVSKLYLRNEEIRTFILSFIYIKYNHMGATPQLRISVRIAGC